MKRIVLVMIAVMILTGCSHTLGGVDSEQKINYSIINNILNTVKEQNYSKLSEMFTVDASSLKRYEVDENMKSVFEKSTYEIVSYEKFDDKILTKVSIDMPFSQELSNVAVMMIMNKTTKENGTPDFTISSEEKEKIWKDAFYEQLNSEIGARVQCEYEVVLVKKMKNGLLIMNLMSF